MSQIFSVYILENAALVSQEFVCIYSFIRNLSIYSKEYSNLFKGEFIIEIILLFN